MKIIITGFSGFIGYHLCNRIFYDQKYNGSAINPDSLIAPNKSAIKHMTKLLEEAGFNQEE